MVSNDLFRSREYTLTVSNITINNVPYTIDCMVETKMLLKSKLKVTGCEIQLVDNGRCK